MNTQFCNSMAPRVLSILRIIVAFLYITHGFSKVFHIPYVATFDNVELFSLLGVAGLLEIIFGAFLLVGLFTRPVAFILSGMMAVAYFIVHAPKGNVLLPMMNGGEPAVLFCFVFLYLAAAGGGAWSVDALMRKS